MSVSHILGFPRIGRNREMKKAVESYWAKEIDRNALQQEGEKIRQAHWQVQKDKGLDWVTVGDFSWYDHVLDTAVMLGVVPERFQAHSEQVDMDTYFRMARGRAPQGEDVTACEMTKWFDTNYHYIVPELAPDQTFTLGCEKLFREIDEAKALGHHVKPVLLGPLTFLWLSKCRPKAFDKLSLLAPLLDTYQQILQRLQEKGIQWVQVDEPILVLDLETSWKAAFEKTYSRFNSNAPKVLLTTYFGGLEKQNQWALQLPVAGFHLDLVKGRVSSDQLIKQIPKDKVLSAGIVNGRNIWRTDLSNAYEALKPLHAHFKENLWVASSCSLLHSPVDVTNETQMAEDILEWLAFSVQKVEEVSVLTQALNQGFEAVETQFKENADIHQRRKHSSKIHNPGVQQRMGALQSSDFQRASGYQNRIDAQHQLLKLPLFPTTTIGSFPQTKEIRHWRLQLKKGEITPDVYKSHIEHEIQNAIKVQEELDLDVLVHGEAERNDMVEYFGQLLEGYVFTQNGWVQSYGSRCVKPPIIYGDVFRKQAMSVDWSCYAKSLTQKPIKGMLTGPVTMLCWSFVRDDQERQQTAFQIALALRDEILDLEKNGIQIIQLDEPAFREGLPLRHQDWPHYLEWAVNAFKLATCGVKDETQIHTHMCYSEFNDVIESIGAMDADVITIETSRSQMELLKAFEDYAYPNEIGPGVYDIHSPRVPQVEEMTSLLEKATDYIPPSRVWVNPDCGLKTRNWLETKEALGCMVQAAKILRDKHNRPSEKVGS